MGDKMEFLKWVSNRHFYLFHKVGDKSMDEYMQNIINTEMNLNLDIVRTANSLKSIETNSSKIFDNLIEDFEKQQYHPGEYSQFPLYTSCSWKTNKKFRQKFDEISYFLYPEQYSE